MCFFGCGFFHPDKKLFFMLTGAFWELLEYALSTDVHFWEERGVNSLWDLWYAMNRHYFVTLANSRLCVIAPS